MAGNSNLHDSARNKQDEFYTQLSLIEKELKHYRSFFAGKTVLCNCDDPYESNFFKYFAMNFNTLGLKKLVTTCYATSPVVGDEFEYYVDNAGQLAFVPDTDTTPLVCSTRRPYRVEITEVTDENHDGRADLADVEYLMRNRKNTMTLLNGDGDFRSPECVELLREADVVVTNPPFSLFREYIALLEEYRKYFIIIGNMNAVKIDYGLGIIADISGSKYLILTRLRKPILRLMSMDRNGGGWETFAGSQMLISKKGTKICPYSGTTRQSYIQNTITTTLSMLTEQ